MDKPTPGPWSFDGPDYNIIIWGAKPETRVCFLTSDGPTKANARLIAAAPDLLEAAQYAIAYLADADDAEYDDEGEEICPFERLRAAIAKATGTDDHAQHGGSVG
jgi:hypothetical protein